MDMFIDYLKIENHKDSQTVTALSNIILKEKNNITVCSIKLAAVLNSISKISKLKTPNLKAIDSFFQNMPCDFLAASNSIIQRNIKKSPKEIACLYLSLFINEFDGYLIEYQEYFGCKHQ